MDVLNNDIECDVSNDEEDSNQRREDIHIIQIKFIF